MKAILLALTFMAMLTPPLTKGASQAAAEIPPVETPKEMGIGVFEWRLGNGWEGGNQRPAYLYLVPSWQCGGACPSTLIIYWQSIHGFVRPTILTASGAGPVWRTGLNTYRVAIETGSAAEECGPASPPSCNTLQEHILLLDTWHRSVRRLR